MQNAKGMPLTNLSYICGIARLGALQGGCVGASDVFAMGSSLRAADRTEGLVVRTGKSLASKD